jgi:hypothetical protein
VLANWAAAEAGAGEAWIEDGKVTEGGSSSCFIDPGRRRDAAERQRILQLHPQGRGRSPN